GARVAVADKPRKKKPAARRPIIDKRTHGAMDRDPLPAMRLHHPAHPVAAAFPPDGVAAKPTTKPRRRVEIAGPVAAHASLAASGVAKRAAPPGPSEGRGSSSRAAAKEAATATRRLGVSCDPSRRQAPTMPSAA